MNSYRGSGDIEYVDNVLTQHMPVGPLSVACDGSVTDGRKTANIRRNDSLRAILKFVTDISVLAEPTEFFISTIPI